MPAVRSLITLTLFTLASSITSAAPILLQKSQMQAMGIETQAAGSGGSRHNGSLPARVVVPPAQMRIIASPVPGLIDSLRVAPGNRVRRGQVLATLVSPQALELQRDVLQATSQAELQQQNMKRDEQLFAEGLIAESRLQSTRAAHQQAQAQASERRQGLALAGMLPGKMGSPLALTAAIDGVVLEQGVQLGQRIEASTLIYRIAQLSPLWLEIQAPLTVANALKEGMPVKLSGQSITGKLITIGRAVDAASQTVLLRAAVTGGSESLSPGQVVEIEISSETANPADATRQTLPASALVRHQGKTLVFIQGNTQPQGTPLEARPVSLISQGGDSVVVDGVRHDEQIVIKGISGLKALLSEAGN